MIAPLLDEIRALIAVEGPIPVSRYMALCLGHPRYGYYITRDPLGARGDFTTAPEISQMFGELVGLWAVAAWQQMGAPSPFLLVELGPGRGTLMADALRAAALVPAFGAAARVHLVETSPVLRAAQRRALADREVSWHDRIEALPDGPAFVIANEFFDALPVDQYVRTAQGWHERRVGLDDQGRLAFGLDPRPALVAAAFAPPGPAPEGAVLERMDAGPALALSRRLAAQGGAALAIDYGHAGGFGDTLQALARHAYADPLEAPGEADLTTHVDFGALARIAISQGVAAYGPIGQGDFLLRLGLQARAERLMAEAGPAGEDAIANAALRLAGTAPGQMGTLFQVLALSAPPPGMPRLPPPAFAPAEAFRG